MVISFGFIEFISAWLASWCDDLAVYLSNVVRLVKNKGYDHLDGVLPWLYEDLPLRDHEHNLEDIFIDSGDIQGLVK
jgi:hypothetical protein